MDITPKQREKISYYIRFVITAFSGGIMITFANFTMITGLVDGTVFVGIMILIGLLIGMYSIEIHYAIMSGILAIFLGFLIFTGVIIIPVVVFATWELYDILVLFGVFVIVRIVMLQLLGIMCGTIIGRWIGPGWYEPTTPKHELRIGIDGEPKETESE